MTISNKEDRIIVNSFASECFRDVADQDYISARILYRHGLLQHFQWAALQAIEKYLKAILLYNGKSAKKLGHDILKALNKVEQIEYIDFQLEDHHLKFIEHINNNGHNRYLEQSSYSVREALLYLDSTIWTIRRFCYVINFTMEIDKKQVNMLEYEIKRINSYKYDVNPNKYRIIGGYLEKVLNGKNDTLRKALVWKNFGYGKRKKNVLRTFKFRGGAVNPPHIRDKKRFYILDKFVDFPIRIRKHFINK